MDIETALSHFDQIPKNHGVPIPKPKIPVITPAPKPDAKKMQVDQQPTNRKIIRDYVVKKTPVKAKSATQAVEQPAQVNDAHYDQEIQAENKMEKPIAVEVPETKPAESDSAAASNIEEDVPVNDDEIAGKIAAFEKELALVCPIYKVNVLTEEKTAAGKIFYTCISEKCNFISWGKPYHIECGRYKNPFLVEVPDSAGQLILKCPRATCQYRQALTPGAVKMVRKRIVRRKV